MLLRTQIDQIKAIQRRAVRTIYSYTNDMPNINALYCVSILSLADRREQMSRKVLKSVLQSSSCFHTLLPTPRHPTITTQLRSANKFPRIPAVPQNTRHFLRSCSLPNFISVLSPITIQFVLMFYFLHLFCVSFILLSYSSCVLLFGFMATKLNKLYYTTTTVVGNWKWTSSSRLRSQHN